MASFTNSPEQLARFAGKAKGVLAGGLAASFGVEAAGLPQLHFVAFNFTLQAVRLVCMVGVTWKCVMETNYGKEEDVEPSAEFQAKEKSLIEA